MNLLGVDPRRAGRANDWEFMRSTWPPNGSPRWRRTRNGVSTNLQHRFAIVVPTPLASLPTMDTTPPDTEKGVKPMYVDAILSQLVLVLLALLVKRNHAFHGLVADAHGSSQR